MARAGEGGGYNDYGATGNEPLFEMPHKDNVKTEVKEEENDEGYGYWDLPSSTPSFTRKRKNGVDSKEEIKRNLKEEEPNEQDFTHPEDPQLSTSPPPPRQVRRIRVKLIPPIRDDTTREEQEEEELPNQCETCGRIYALQYLLRRHKLLDQCTAPKHKQLASARMNEHGHSLMDGCYLREIWDIVDQLTLDQAMAGFFRCDICDILFFSARQQMLHVKKLHASWPSERLCKNNYCKQTRMEADREVLITGRSTLHRSMFHPMNDDIKCPGCYVTLPSYHALYIHFGLHLDRLMCEFHCSGCNSSFISPKQLQHHIIQMIIGGYRSCHGKAQLIVTRRAIPNAPTPLAVTSLVTTVAKPIERREFMPRTLEKPKLVDKPKSAAKAAEPESTVFKTDYCVIDSVVKQEPEEEKEEETENCVIDSVVKQEIKEEPKEETDNCVIDSVEIKEEPIEIKEKLEEDIFDDMLHLEPSQKLEESPLVVSAISLPPRKISSKKAARQAVMVQAKSNNEFECSGCKKVFKYAFLLKQHENLICPTRKIPPSNTPVTTRGTELKCAKCQLHFYSLVHLMKHQREGKCKCTLTQWNGHSMDEGCMYKVPQYGMDEHFLRCCRPPAGAMHGCIVCGLEMTSVDHLRHHVDKFHPQRIEAKLCRHVECIAYRIEELQVR